MPLGSEAAKRMELSIRSMAPARDAEWYVGSVPMRITFPVTAGDQTALVSSRNLILSIVPQLGSGMMRALYLAKSAVV